ncbi:MAG: PLP-dependent transferase, partial [Promethearchaeia archaeon]
RWDTRVTNAGRRTEEFSTDPLGRSVVNVPVYRASTVTFPNTTALRARPQATATAWEGLFYGRFGTQTHRALEDAFTVLEHGHRACTASSVEAAVASVLLGVLSAGDELLVSANASPYLKRVCAHTLGRLGVSSTSFPADAAAADIDALFQRASAGLRPGQASRCKAVLVQGAAPPDLAIPDLDAVVR